MYFDIPFYPPPVLLIRGEVCEINKTVVLGCGIWSNGASGTTSRTSLTYTSGNNHEPDGGSTGTRIVVPRP